MSGQSSGAGSGGRGGQSPEQNISIVSPGKTYVRQLSAEAVTDGVMVGVAVLVGVGSGVGVNVGVVEEGSGV